VNWKPSWWPLRIYTPAALLVIGLPLAFAWHMNSGGRIWLWLVVGFIVVTEAGLPFLSRWVDRANWRQVEKSDDPVLQSWGSKQSWRDLLRIRRWTKDANRREAEGLPPIPMEYLHPKVQEFIRLVNEPPHEPEAWKR
jgi:hypothetical protein